VGVENGVVASPLLFCTSRWPGRMGSSISRNISAKSDAIGENNVFSRAIIARRSNRHLKIISWWQRRQWLAKKLAKNMKSERAAKEKEEKRAKKSIGKYGRIWQYQ